MLVHKVTHWVYYTVRSAVRKFYIAIYLYFMQGKFQPIHGAATQGHLNIVQTLIDTYKVDPTVKTKVSVEA